MLWIGPALAGAASLVGGLLGNRSRATEAEKNRQFQAEQSSTAWQRSVKDLEAAGLNPALAYSQGPASSPGGSMAQQQDVVSPAVSSAMQAADLRARMSQVREATRKLEHEADTAHRISDREAATNAVLGITKSPTGKLRFDLEKGPLKRRILAETASAEANAKMLQLQLPYLKWSARAVEDMPWSVYLERASKGGLPLITGLGGAAASKLLRRR